MLKFQQPFCSPNWQKPVYDVTDQLGDYVAEMSYMNPTPQSGAAQQDDPPFLNHPNYHHHHAQVCTRFYFIMLCNLKLLSIERLYIKSYKTFFAV